MFPVPHRPRSGETVTTLTQQAHAVGHDVALIDYFATVGTRKGTKYTHPVKALRFTLSCSCGWGATNISGLREARERGREHMAAVTNERTEDGGSV